MPMPHRIRRMCNFRLFPFLLASIFTLLMWVISYSH